MIRVLATSVIGVGVGLVVGYIPGGIAGVLIGILGSSGMMPSDSGGYAEATLISSLVWLACAGAITALIQTRMNHDRGLLPKWWVMASASGWALIALLRIGPRGVDLGSAILGGILFSLVGAVMFVLLTRRAALGK